MTDGSFEPNPPHSDTLTSYDKDHLITYLRLLDADAENASWQEAVKIIFSIDPAIDEAGAKQLFDSQLARAKWMTQSGYSELLKQKNN